MLLQRRTKELERQKWNSSIKSTIDPDEKVIYQCYPMIRKHIALIIREPSSADVQVGSNHDVNTFSSSFDKGKNVAHPFSVFERGSTSRASKGQQNLFPDATGKEASKIGKKTFLPVTFIGGPRDMRRRYMDVIALVQRFGKPDIFLTMTCNPSWPEIKQHLLSTDETQNRPDLVSRVFRGKVEELKADILKKNIFGKVAAFMYTIEFQKRGPPHAHFLIILTCEYKLLAPESYDKFVCAELPDCNTEEHLYSRVLQHMMHGPCVDLNPTNSCMGKRGLCKFNYPKDFAEQTSKGKNSYPIYRRRSTGKLVHIREQYLNNSWDVPYNPYLLCKFDCHMNIEVCSDIKVVKYIYKYICKGHDKIAFCIHNNNEIDEIKEYRSARWVTPPEAAWRLFGFPISEMTPTVYHLQLHLEGQQFVSFKSSETVNRILNNPMIRKTMLTEFFAMNRTNEHAIAMQLLYKEFPEHFVWSPGYRTWTRR
ncbi:uncharacterized protein LOC107819940 isoform X2 [Nicotiana tabacum]|uniref:Uncharacterized protein LOC107819940 isoform X2 n=1 Tax=Nicotiana tabacum TaxID=4097 RepID=A0AC58UD56_TOBAC